MHHHQPGPSQGHHHSDGDYPSWHTDTDSNVVPIPGPTGKTPILPPPGKHHAVMPPKGEHPIMPPQGENQIMPPKVCAFAPVTVSPAQPDFPNLFYRATILTFPPAESSQPISPSITGDLRSTTAHLTITVHLSTILPNGTTIPTVTT